MKEYRIVLESQLGPREGILRVEEERGGAVKGTLTLMGHENRVQGRWTGKHSLRLSHHLRTQVSDLACVSVFETHGEQIRGTLCSGSSRMEWHGEIAAGTTAGREKHGGR